MPMDFPAMNSLKRCAAAWKFREPDNGESEEAYRDALADFVETRDFVESCEIRNKVGWDKFNRDQQNDMLRRSCPPDL